MLKQKIQRTAMLAMALAAGPWAQADTVTLPHYPITNQNLLSNGSFSGSASPWSLQFYDATKAIPSAYEPMYDGTVTSTDGSGSIHFYTRPGSSNYAQIYSESITSFQRNKPYTISYRIKTQHQPLYTSATIFQYTSTGGSVSTLSTGDVTAVSTTGEWQEVTAVVTITDPSVTRIHVVIGVAPSPSYSNDFWIDDVYFGEGIVFAQPPSTTRDPFPHAIAPEDAYVNVDALGNWKVKGEDNQWHDFFPFGLYPFLGRTDFISLANQGFNTVLGMNYASQVLKAKNAGMRACLRLATYAIDDPAWPLTVLQTNINNIQGGGLNKSLLCYEWDNEEHWLNWNHWKDMVSTIRALDVTHPIYILNGYPAVQRAFNNLSEVPTDVSGTYVGTDIPGTSASGVGRFEILQNLEKQTVPVSIAQINEVDETDYGFRLRVYDALIKGARGIMWLGNSETDDVPGRSPVEDRPWWDDVPNLSHELEEMIPILKEPHWTSWSATSSDASVKVGTRTHQGEGYMIVVNPQNSSTTATFSLTGVAATQVYDYFNHGLVATISAGQFSVTLQPHSTAVYRLAFPEQISNGALESTTGWTATGAGTFTIDDTVKYAGAHSLKIVNGSTADDSQYQQFFAALKPGTRYHFSAMVKTEAVVKADADAYKGAIVQLYTGGLNQFIELPGLDGTAGWKEIKADFTTPASPDANWYIRLRLRNASGSAWFDNVSLKERLP